MRPLVDFPAYGDFLHLQAEDHHHIANVVPAEVRDAESSVGIVRLNNCTSRTEQTAFSGISLSDAFEKGTKLTIELCL